MTLIIMALASEKTNEQFCSALEEAPFDPHGTCFWVNVPFAGNTSEKLQFYTSLLEAAHSFQNTLDVKN